MKDIKDIFSLQKDIKDIFKDTSEKDIYKNNPSMEIKIGKKLYNIKELSNIIQESSFLEKKTIEIKQYILENVITDEEQYISLEEIKTKKGRYLEIRNKVTKKCRIELLDFLTHNDMGPATSKTLIDNIAEWIIKDFFDYGLLYEILKKPKITNIKIENGFILYTEMGSKDTKIWEENNFILSNKEVERLITKISRNSISLSTSSPIVDTVLPKLGYRVNMILKSLTSSSTHVVTIRKNYDFINFEFYIKSNYFPNKWERAFEKLVNERQNIVIAGGTGSGKTSLLNSIAKDLISDKESIITIEDTPEIFVNKPAFVGFYSKEHVAKVGDLFKASLRQQPDRILVGEIRDGNMAYYMIQAMNTGHDGNISTIHASSAPQVLSRLNNLLKQSDEAGGYDEKTISSMIRNSINYIVYVGHVREKTEKNFKLLDVIKVKDTDPFFKYKDELDEIEKTLSEKNINVNENRINNSLNYINLKMKYSLIEYEYLLKYDKDENKYVINKIEEFL